MAIFIKFIRSHTSALVIFLLLIVIAVSFFFFTRGQQFSLPKGNTVPINTQSKVGEVQSEDDIVFDEQSNEISITDDKEPLMQKSTRQIFETDGVKHSIPIEEILSGGPPKDGIPSIDNPQFISVKKAGDFLTSESIGLGLLYKGEARFYPYAILVWHELVNDVVAGDPLLISYCPLCLTGIVFERTLDGEVVEFGVSGRLWRSNLLMYNRTDNPDEESLWSQVLGEAVLGEFTGQKLVIVPSDSVRFGDWREKYSETQVLSRDTGALRSYGRDPYGDYYTDNQAVSFGASFNDTRLEAKDFVLGIEINGQFKAYHGDVLPEGITTDTFANNLITIEKSSIGEVRMFIGDTKQLLPYIGSFWFSWLAVHPDTELY